MVDGGTEGRGMKEDWGGNKELDDDDGRSLMGSLCAFSVESFLLWRDAYPEQVAAMRTAMAGLSYWTGRMGRMSGPLPWFGPFRSNMST